MGSWWNSRTSSTKLLWLIMLFMAVALFIGIKNSNWVDRLRYYPRVKHNLGVAPEGHVSFGHQSMAREGGTVRMLRLKDEMDVELLANAKENGPNARVNGSDFFAYTNQTVGLRVETSINKKYTILNKLEARLGKVRAAIKNGKSINITHDLDYVPNGEIYRNAALFHRSYLEMENQFKVFVYEEGEPPVFHDGPCTYLYATEGHFIHQMETTKFRTKNPDEAHTFFLSISTTMIRQYIFEHDPNVNDWIPMRQTINDYVDLVKSKYPFWNRSQGSDHFIVACHDWGPELSKSVPCLVKNSIRAFCNANTSEGFNPSKDVSIPELLLPEGVTQGLQDEPSISNRPILAFFAGGNHGPVRPTLFQHWHDKDPEVQVHSYLPKGVSYMSLLRQSKYCISPSGYEVASPRMVESLYTGCVPVLIKDHYVAPFNDVLKWESFAIMLEVKDIPNLKIILTKIPTRQYRLMQQRGKQVRRHFEMNDPPKRYDVFHMILHSIWLRRLNIKIQGVADSG